MIEKERRGRIFRQDKTRQDKTIIRASSVFFFFGVVIEGEEKK